MQNITTIITGGQTGVDRAAMDTALELGLDLSGHCPVGGWAEDYPDPPGLLVDYPQLSPMGSVGIEERTMRNVLDSDATLVISRGNESRGTMLALKTASENDKPYLITDPGNTAEVREWIAALGEGLRLNVAGPRESEDPGIYTEARKLLAAILAPKKVR